MGQTQRPQTQIGSRMRNTPQEILNRVNALLDRNLAHVELFYLVKLVNYIFKLNI